MGSVARALKYAFSGKLPLHLKRRFGSRKQAFEAIYKLNYWQDGESVSGPGSTLEATKQIRGSIEHVVRTYGIKSMLDAPCGDFNWMQHVDLAEVDYTGGDIVDELIARNQAKHGGPRRRFKVVDLTSDDLGAYDLVHTRDCIAHLPFVDVLRVLRNISRSGSKYLLVTTSPRVTTNEDLSHPGSWRPLNLRLPPIGLGEPLELLPDAPRNDRNEKFAALYKLPLQPCP